MFRITVPIRSLPQPARVRMLVECASGTAITFIIAALPYQVGLPATLLLGVWIFSFVPRNSMNPMLCGRLVVLVTPGLVSALVLWWNPNLFVTELFIEYQTQPIVFIVNLICCFAGWGTVAAWLVFGDQTSQIAPRVRNSADILEWKFAWSFFFILGLAFKFLGTGTQAAPIWQAAYGYSEAPGTVLGIQVFGAAGTMCFASMMAIGLLHPNFSIRMRIVTIVTILLVVLSTVARGSRNDIVTFAATFYILFPFIKGRNFSGWVVAFGIYFFSIVAATIGSVRTYLIGYESFSDQVLDAVSALIWPFKLIEMSIGGVFWVHVPAIAGSPLVANVYLLFGAVGALEDQLFHFLYGESFLNMIVNTLPRGINPYRRVDIAWMFNEHGLASAGGFLETSEAYLNFGYIGALLICFAISAIYFSAFRGAMRNLTLRNISFLASISPMIVVASNYGLNSFYKSLLTWSIIFLTFRIAWTLFGPRRGSEGSLEAQPVAHA